jgi:hypothetical protein
VATAASAAVPPGVADEEALAWRLNNEFQLALAGRQALTAQARVAAAHIAWHQAYLKIYPLEGEQFETFGDWFEYATSNVQVSAQTLSGIYNFCVYAVEATRRHGLPYTLEQLCALDEHRAQRLGSAAKKLHRLARQAELGALLDAAFSAPTREAFEEVIERMGLRKPQGKLFRAYGVLNADGTLTLRMTLDLRDPGALRLLDKIEVLYDDGETEQTPSAQLGAAGSGLADLPSRQ